MSVDLRHGDCLEVMRELPDASIDLVLTDPPYGTTQCKWDSVIPLNAMWLELKRITKPKAAICLFGAQPFSSALVMSNPKWFRYEWVWDKSRPTGHMNAKRRPLNVTESVLVFYPETANYYPQLRDRDPKKVRRTDGVYAANTNQVYGKGRQARGYTEGRTIPVEKGYPLNLVRFKAIGTFGSKRMHPVQKPVELLRYLIRTYTQVGDTVLDFTMGSGSTGAASVLEGCRFIGIEKEAAYFAMAKERIQRTLIQPSIVNELHSKSEA